MMHPDELKNDEYGHCGECHEVHLNSKMVEIDGYLYCKKCATPPARSIGEIHQQSAARIAALEADKAKLIDLLKKYQDGYYTDGVIGLTAGFDEAVSRVLAEVTK